MCVPKQRDTLMEPLFSTQAILEVCGAKFSLSAITPIPNLCLYKEAHCHHSRLCFHRAKTLVHTELSYNKEIPSLNPRTKLLWIGLT